MDVAVRTDRGGRFESSRQRTLHQQATGFSFLDLPTIIASASRERKKQVPGTTKEFSAPGVAWIEVDSSTGEKLRVVSCSRGEGDRRERASFPPYLKPPSVRRRASSSIVRK